ncbi:MAG TPA: trypsin-like peptidase domain-containing protein, partial [Phenylobacterium sp.]
MASAWPQLDADHALRAATFRLVTPSGGFAGTGFLADGEGRLITCHHVAAPHAALRAIDQGGQAWEATPESLDDPILAAADMAIVRLAGPPAAAPLPLVPREPGDAFASRVQLADAKAFRDSTPLTGELLGPSGIS